MLLSLYFILILLLRADYFYIADFKQNNIDEITERPTP